MFNSDLLGGQLFDFGSLGVDRFEVLGIDPNLGLDPNNGTAFITDLTFVGPGRFTGTMTPITLEIAVPVPEPSTWAMMFVSFAGIGFMGYQRSRKQRAALAG